MDFQSSPRNLQKQRKRKTDLSPGTLDFPRITQHPTNTIYMSLGFAFGTLDCFLFQHEALFLSLLEQRTEEDRRLCAFWPKMATPTVREGWGSTRRLPCIHKTTQLGPRRLVVAWPRSPLRHGGRPWWPCSGVAIGRGRERAGGGNG